MDEGYLQPLLAGHFNLYLMIGGVPELVLSADDIYSQRMLREDVVDKAIKREVFTYKTKEYVIAEGNLREC